MKSAVISVGGNDYQVIFHRDKANAKAPTMVYVNQVGNSSIGAYVYTIGKGGSLSMYDYGEVSSFVVAQCM